MGKFLLPVLVIFSASSASAGDIFSAMQAKMRYHGKQQATLSHNVANADTPGFKAREVEAVDFMAISGQGPKGIRLKTTSPAHIGGNKERVSFKTVRDRDTYETSPDGNNVVLEEQMHKMAENNMGHRTTLGTMRKMVGIMRSAIGTGN